MPLLTQGRKDPPIEYVSLEVDMRARKKIVKIKKEKEQFLHLSKKECPSPRSRQLILAENQATKQMSRTGISMPA